MSERDMSEHSVDLAAYCARIGYSGPLEPTLATLRALQELHPAAITFEAIDVLLDRGVDLSPRAVDDKLIVRGRGGYCYEQNGLFKRVLEAIGFEVEGLIARVNWHAPPDAPLAPPSHMALRVTVDAVPWLVDVGFGSCVPTAPIRLACREPQSTRHEIFRLTPASHGLQLEASIAGKWQPVYRLAPTPMLDGDYELHNWFTATHPGSHFRHRLIVTRTTPDARHVLADARLTVRGSDGTVHRETLDADAIERALAERFALPVESDWRPIIERAAAASASG
ncbi:arylamine N-acetyltransferase [Pelagerythrobacter marensis]|uniref:Arylamine N-acetyltransferase n=1 Tax=Pelagerythrobacter marensis TaxID=543877 RepID=A0ABZ2DBL3_9SPHN